MTDKPFSPRGLPCKDLFIPLKAIYYDAFKGGDKTYEMRVYGVRWNEKTCRIGRKVLLSRGYGKKDRMLKIITNIAILDFSSLDNLHQNELHFCYGDPIRNEKIIFIYMGNLNAAERA